MSGSDANPSGPAGRDTECVLNHTFPERDSLRSSKCSAPSSTCPRQQHNEMFSERSPSRSTAPTSSGLVIHTRKGKGGFAATAMRAAGEIGASSEETAKHQVRSKWCKRRRQCAARSKASLPSPMWSQEEDGRASRSDDGVSEESACAEKAVGGSAARAERAQVQREGRKSEKRAMKLREVLRAVAGVPAEVAEGVSPRWECALARKADADVDEEEAVLAEEPVLCPWALAQEAHARAEGDALALVRSCDAFPAPKICMRSGWGGPGTTVTGDEHVELVNSFAEVLSSSGLPRNLQLFHRPDVPSDPGLPDLAHHLHWPLQSPLFGALSFRILSRTAQEILGAFPSPFSPLQAQMSAALLSTAQPAFRSRAPSPGGTSTTAVSGLTRLVCRCPTSQRLNS